MLKKLQKWIKNFFYGSLDIIEKVGNALPHPATLFAIFALLIVVASGIFARIELSVVHPATGEIIRPVSLLSVEGLHRILLDMVTNFTSFAPLGTVLVAMLGIGLAESSGLISAGLKLLVLSAPARLLTFVIVLAGILSNMASEIGYVLLVPLAAIIFQSVGRHPLAGLAAAFAGVSGGYSANLLLGTIDPLLAGISQEAARIIDPAYEVNAAANYYFMFVSTFIIAYAGTWVTERLVEPRLGHFSGDVENDENINRLTDDEKRGLWFAALASLVFTAVVLWGILPENGFLREIETGSILSSPFLKGIVAFIFLGSIFVSIAYGYGAKTIRNDSEVMNGMGKAISTLGTYIVLVFFAAQFVAYFNWTKLGLIFAVKGAQALKAAGLGDIILMLSFVILSAIINLFMGSASAKWAIMAPIFIPMFMILGYTPEFVQAAYRIGDSTSNIIAPMMSYFALIVAFVEKYDKKAGIGTVIALMIPYTFVFLLIWSVMLAIWILFGLPVGPGATLFLQ
ncbi:MAG: AbgT family transporter [Caldithrix sp.]|nr:AbgT family transporter [Caldithrix sp.]